MEGSHSLDGGSFQPIITSHCEILLMRRGGLSFPAVRRALEAGSCVCVYGDYKIDTCMDGRGH